jgi:hypothetical protein
MTRFLKSMEFRGKTTQASGMIESSGFYLFNMSLPRKSHKARDV